LRFHVVGAGAIGGVVGARLQQAGHDVVLVARGDHRAAIAATGLRLETPDESVTLRVPVVGDPADLDMHDGDVVLLAVKSHDTEAALFRLRRAAAPSTPIVCLQNGLENERRASRLFANVYGVCVMCPTTHVQPGVVQASSSPVTGILDLGRFPEGVDDTAHAVAAVFDGATFSSVPRPDIRRWKRQKLLLNLGNAVEALCGPAARRGRLVEMARAEGEACFRAAGLDVATAEEDRERRGDLLTLRPVGDQRRGGGSTWQSLARGAGTVETDFLNGEIVLLGREHGVATPVNELLQQLMWEAALAQHPPEAMTEEQVLARLA
jgi:2-dehydropantoate 2-reductase